jgi:hypothetical protein
MYTAPCIAELKYGTSDTDWLGLVLSGSELSSVPEISCNRQLLFCLLVRQYSEHCQKGLIFVSSHKK